MIIDYGIQFVFPIFNERVINICFEMFHQKVEHKFAYYWCWRWYA